MRVLIVEDERRMATHVGRALAAEAFAVDIAGDGLKGLELARSYDYDAIVLDLMLPALDGLTVCRTLRAEGRHTPVLILSARDMIEDRVNGLDAGADDYLGKPCALLELEARVRALLRRARSVDGDTVKFGSLTFDTVERQVFVRGKLLLLTAREIAVLETLLQRAGRIVSKETIFASIYDLDSEASTSAIEVYISRVRKKLDAAEAGVGIRVLRGLGYRLELQEEHAES